MKNIHDALEQSIDCKNNIEKYTIRKKSCESYKLTKIIYKHKNSGENTQINKRYHTQSLSL